jgi:hypothetical protein
MTEDPKVEEKNDDTIEHIVEATGMMSSMLTLVGFIFPVARIWALGIGAASNVLKYFSKGKKHE